MKGHVVSIHYVYQKYIYKTCHFNLSIVIILIKLCIIQTNVSFVVFQSGIFYDDYQISEDEDVF